LDERHPVLEGCEGIDDQFGEIEFFQRTDADIVGPQRHAQRLHFVFPQAVLEQDKHEPLGSGRFGSTGSLRRQGPGQRRQHRTARCQAGEPLAPIDHDNLPLIVWRQD
jgi:hypothetical protein